MTLVARLCDAIERLRPESRITVAIDGPDAAGKTTLADALAQQTARPTLRASIDDWHQPRAVRLQRGQESPDGYYVDSFDYQTFAARLLRPFREGATLVQRVGHDFGADAPAPVHAEVRSPTAVLLLDGVFLLRPELRHHWDLSVYLHVSESVTMARAVVRDAHDLGGPEAVRRRYERRYLPGQALYRDAASPLDQADILVDNSNPRDPLVMRWRTVE